MTEATTFLSRVDAAGFAIIGLLAVVGWVRHRGSTRACLAAALGLLGLVSLVGQLATVVRLPAPVAIVNLACFMGSGYALVELRHQLIPLPQRIRSAVIGLILVTSILAIPATLATPTVRPSTFSWIVGSLLILEWTACIAEPAMQFWLASRGRPAVQRYRLRSLSVGYLSIALALVLALGAAVGAAATSTKPSAAVGLAFQIVATAAIPLFYVGFAPPRWLRRAWRDREADEYRRANQALVTFADDRSAMAARAVEWAMRFVGAGSGALLEADGTVLASRGMTGSEAQRLSQRVAASPGQPELLDGSTVAVPVAGADAWLIVAAGPFTPFFGSDEVRVLASYAVAVATALERVRLSEQLRHQTVRLESLLTAVSELGAGLLITDGGRLSYANEAYLRLTGYDRLELEGRSLIELAPADQRSELQERLQARLGGGDAPLRYESQVVRKDGTIVDVEAVVHILPNEGPGRLISLVQDISARKRAEAALAETARLDPLTGVPNRRAWKEQLAAAIAHSSRSGEALCVAILDLDSFKEFNDDWGHARGDRLLINVALAWKHALREGDFLARFGGDEFAILMPACSALQAERVLERLMTATPEHASVGVAEWDRAESSDELVARADAALLRSKKERRGRVTIACGQPEGDRFTSWSSRLDTILERRYLTSAYQPIVELASGSVLGHEALLRPSGAAADTSVEELFTAAQRLGYARDLDWLSRRAALEGARSLPEEQLLFVNVSAWALLDPIHGSDQMLMLLRWAGRSASEVVLEISEREMISNLDRLREVLAEYRAHGFRFALDDVGEGHSTLEVLAAANSEYIKIARSLVEGLDETGPGSAVRAIVTFAQSNGATVVAEGISDLALVDKVRALGVLYGQGFALGMPQYLSETEAPLLEAV